MKININKIWGYYINPDSFAHRRNSIEQTVENLGLKGTTRIAFNEQLNERANTMSMAHITALKQAIEDNNFPCIIFEDDAKQMTLLPEYFDIPEEATLIYLGGSNYESGQTPKMYLEEYNEEYYRVYYMLSFHSVLIPRKEVAEGLIIVLENAIVLTKFNDISIANLSETCKYLVPREGNYFYQNDYTENVTKFLWKDYLLKNKLK